MAMVFSGAFHEKLKELEARVMTFPSSDAVILLELIQALKRREEDSLSMACGEEVAEAE